MSLDFRVLKEKKFSTEYAGLDVDTHTQLMQIAHSLNLPLLNRIEDYYGSGIAYRQDELSNLAQEVEKIIEHSKDSAILESMQQLKNIIHLAVQENKPIEVLPD